MVWNNYRRVILKIMVLLGVGLGVSFSVNLQGFKKQVIEYTTDQSVTIAVELVFSQDSIPQYYVTRLKSPICMDNLCNPIDIEIEWDLLGNFRNYNEIPGDPITKFDHQLFTEEDHHQLKSILSDKSSLLQDYKMEDLVDTTDLVYSEEIDGMTGATSKTFANEVVEGAIYTCYVLWYVVNEDLDDQILNYTESIMDDQLLLSMIKSGGIDYLNYILDGEPQRLSPKVNTALGELIWDSDPLISVKAISIVSDEYWLEDSTMNLFADRFLHMANPVQNALIRHFQNADVTRGWLSVFIGLLAKMQENQRYQVYEILKFNTNEFDTEIKKDLVSALKISQISMTAKEYELLSVLGINY